MRDAWMAVKWAFETAGLLVALLVELKVD